MTYLIDHIEGTADITNKSYDANYIKGISVTNFGTTSMSLTLLGFSTAITIPAETTWEHPVNIKSFSLDANGNSYAIDVRA